MPAGPFAKRPARFSLLDFSRRFRKRPPFSGALSPSKTAVQTSRPCGYRTTFFKLRIVLCAEKFTDPKPSKAKLFARCYKVMRMCNIALRELYLLRSPLSILRQNGRRISDVSSSMRLNSFAISMNAALRYAAGCAANSCRIASNSAIESSNRSIRSSARYRPSSLRAMPRRATGCTAGGVKESRSGISCSCRVV